MLLVNSIVPSLACVFPEFVGLRCFYCTVRKSLQQSGYFAAANAKRIFELGLLLSDSDRVTRISACPSVIRLKLRKYEFLYRLYIELKVCGTRQIQLHSTASMKYFSSNVLILFFFFFFFSLYFNSDRNRFCHRVSGQNLIVKSQITAGNFEN